MKHSPDGEFRDHESEIRFSCDLGRNRLNIWRKIGITVCIILGAIFGFAAGYVLEKITVNVYMLFESSVNRSK